MNLTWREKTVVDLIRQNPDISNQEIADELVIERVSLYRVIWSLHKKYQTSGITTHKRKQLVKRIIGNGTYYEQHRTITRQMAS